MNKMIVLTREEVRARAKAERKTPEYAERMKRLRNIRDEDIDFSDNPEITDEDFASGKLVLKRGGARPGAGRKRLEKKKEFVSISVDADTAKMIRKKASLAGVGVGEFLRCRVA